MFMMCLAARRVTQDRLHLAVRAGSSRTAAAYQCGSAAKWKRTHECVASDSPTVTFRSQLPRQQFVALLPVL